MESERVRRRSDGDLRLAARAARECWPVPEGKREELVRLLFETATGPPGKDRSVAIRALVDLARHNVEALRAAGELEYADLAAEVEELKRAQLGEAPAGGPPAEGDPGNGPGPV